MNWNSWKRMVGIMNYDECERWSIVANWRGTNNRWAIDCWTRNESVRWEPVLEEPTEEFRRLNPVRRPTQRKDSLGRAHRTTTRRIEWVNRLNLNRFAVARSLSALDELLAFCVGNGRWHFLCWIACFSSIFSTRTVCWRQPNWIRSVECSNSFHSSTEEKRNEKKKHSALEYPNRNESNPKWQISTEIGYANAATTWFEMRKIKSRKVVCFFLLKKFHKHLLVERSNGVHENSQPLTTQRPIENDTTGRGQDRVYRVV